MKKLFLMAVVLCLPLCGQNKEPGVSVFPVYYPAKLLQAFGALATPGMGGKLYLYVSTANKETRGFDVFVEYRNHKDGDSVTLVDFCRKSATNTTTVCVLHVGPSALFSDITVTPVGANDATWSINQKPKQL